MVNYAKFINLVSASRKPSAIRVLTALKAQSGPSMISLAGGNPNPLLFPFKEATFKLRGGKVLHLNEDKMKVALQYDASPGNADLLKVVKKLQNVHHQPPLFENSDKSKSTDVCITYGSTDGLSKSFEMLVTPGSKVLVEEPINPVILAALQPLGCEVIPVKTDINGIIPESLSSACKGSDDVKFLVTTPNGQIPTGMSTSSDRRREIYQIVSQNDFLILENDPFHMLQYDEYKKPSYLSLDEDGRVLRFDSFSTTLSPGLRVGYVTGPKTLVDRIVLHLMSSSMHVSTLSQMLVFEYLNGVGLNGYQEHVKIISETFKARRDAALESAKKWLSELAEWHVPDAGTSLWLKLNGRGGDDMREYIQNHNVLVGGDKFSVNSKTFDQYAMVPYGENTTEDIDNVFQDLAGELRKFS